MRFKMDDGTVLDTANATRTWEEERDSNGSNRIGRLSGSQWTWQELHRSRKGRYYTTQTSQWQGSTPHAEWVSPQEAARWLMMNDDSLPEELEKYEEALTE